MFVCVFGREWGNTESKLVRVTVSIYLQIKCGYSGYLMLVCDWVAEKGARTPFILITAKQFILNFWDTLSQKTRCLFAGHCVLLALRVTTAEEHAART